MTKLETLLACLPDAPFKARLTEEIEHLRAYNIARTDELIAATRRIKELEAENAELRKENGVLKFDGIRLQFFYNKMEICSDGWVSDAIFIKQIEGCCDLRDSIDAAMKVGAGGTAHVPETNFGNMTQAVDSSGSPHADGTEVKS